MGGREERRQIGVMGWASCVDSRTSLHKGRCREADRTEKDGIHPLPFSLLKLHYSRITPYSHLFMYFLGCTVSSLLLMAASSCSAFRLLLQRRLPWFPNMSSRVWAHSWSVAGFKAPRPAESPGAGIEPVSPCTGRQILNPCTTREVPPSTFQLGSQHQLSQYGMNYLLKYLCLNPAVSLWIALCITIFAEAWLKLGFS